MGDSVRAEARRRKILENSQKRLERITGREEKPILIKEKTADFENTERPKDDVDNATIFTTRHENDFEPPQLLDSHSFEDNMESLFNSPEQKEIQNSVLHKVVRCRLHIVILALIVYVLHLFTNMNDVMSKYFFLPLIIMNVTEYFLIEQTTSNSTLKTILALSGVDTQKLHLIFKVTNFIQKISHDACLYLFTHVILHLIFGSNKEYQIM